MDEVLQPHPQFEATLASPRISPADKAALLDRILGGRISDPLLTFLKVVGQHGRLNCLRQIRRAARDELNRLRHRVSVLVTTSEPLNNDLRQNIVARSNKSLANRSTYNAELIPKSWEGWWSASVTPFMTPALPIV